MRGRLAQGELPPAEGGPPIVVLSSMSHGHAISPIRESFSLKYVAAGEEVYTYGGRPIAVRAGQFLVVPPGHAGAVELRRSATNSNLGLCLTLPPSLSADLDAPMLLNASASVLGRRIAEWHSRLRRAPDLTSRAGDPMSGISSSLDHLLEESIRHIAGLNQLRPSARMHLYERLCAARDHLHEVQHRPVSLSELAKHAGISKFHLLRNFRDCFGASPAVYQRRQRLISARDAIQQHQMTYTEAAHQFGFADASSFSHAYKRVFGTAPGR